MKTMIILMIMMRLVKMVLNLSRNQTPRAPRLVMVTAIVVTVVQKLVLVATPLLPGLILSSTPLMMLVLLTLA
jgi:hypothetical protein